MTETRRIIRPIQPNEEYLESQGFFYNSEDDVWVKRKMRLTGICARKAYFSALETMVKKMMKDEIKNENKN